MISPVITCSNFRKRKAVLLMWLVDLNCPYYHELKFSPRKDEFSQKYGSFDDITWNLNCPYYRELDFLQNILDLMKSFENLYCCYYLPRVKIFAKVSQFCWSDLKVPAAPIITSWNICKNMAVVMMSLEDLNCSYYHELKFSQKYGRFYEVTWKLTLPLSSGVKIFGKIRLLYWCDLNIWSVTIITSWSFCEK